MFTFDINNLNSELKLGLEKLLSKIKHEDLLTLINSVKEISLNKGDIYFKEGQNFGKIAYVTKGIVRSVYQKNAEEITGGFFTEGSIVCAHTSLLHKKPSNYSVIAIEETKLVEIDNAFLGELYNKDAGFSEWGREIINREFGNVIERMESHILDTPEERYIKLLTTNREIFLRVPQKYIASYLGITAVSLSRIRSRVLKKS